MRLFSLVRDQLVPRRARGTYPRPRFGWLYSLACCLGCVLIAAAFLAVKISLFAATEPQAPSSEVQAADPEKSPPATNPATNMGDISAGKTLYHAKCAACHGQKGEGSDQHDQTLQGDRSVAQLADYIHKTMPEDAPGTLSAVEAANAASYVYHEFYSLAARERHKPPRIELSRLTVKQYRQAVADLVGSFRQATPLPTQTGLNGLYYAQNEFHFHRNFKKDRLVQERVDPTIKFDFGTTAPVKDKMSAEHFAIRWEGALQPPETGEYEFIVRTEHAAALHVNNETTPLIDAWVKSGNESEYRGSIFLVGGRLYPLRLDFCKGKQVPGNKSKDKKENSDVSASIELLWKRPHAPAETIPPTAFAPVKPAESFVCATAFPPDDRSYGWERGTTISAEWDSATTAAALEATGYILANLNNILEVDEQHPERLKKLQDFCETWLARAWRRELTVEERKSYIEQQFAATDPPEAAKRVLILGLKSPQFLYRDIQPQNTPFARAEQLAWALWDSLPDQSLRDAAAKNELQTPEQIRDQIERMLRDTRAVFKLKSFLLAWLKADQIQDLAKDQTKFPGFDEALIADLRTSLELQLEDFLRSGGDVLATADVRDLFRQRQIYLNGRLAKFYGIDAPADAPFAKYELNPNERAGVLTHPYLMTSFAHNATTSPIHRGVFLARGILGMSLRPPPEAVAPLAPDLHPDLTTRQRVALQTKANVCMSCHGIINPLGFALEQFDAVGRFRTEENGQPIDASGSYLTRDGQLVKVNNARELADFLLSSSEAQEAFCTQLFHHLIQQPVRAYGSQSAPELVTTLVEGNHQLKPLIIAILLKSTLAPPPNFADTP